MCLQALRPLASTQKQVREQTVADYAATSICVLVLPVSRQYSVPEPDACSRPELRGTSGVTVPSHSVHTWNYAQLYTSSLFSVASHNKLKQGLQTDSTASKRPNSRLISDKDAQCASLSERRSRKHASGPPGGGPTPGCHRCNRIRQLTLGAGCHRGPIKGQAWCCKDNPPGA